MFVINNIFLKQTVSYITRGVNYSCIVISKDKASWNLTGSGYIRPREQEVIDHMASGQQSDKTYCV